MVVELVVVAVLSLSSYSGWECWASNSTSRSSRWWSRFSRSSWCDNDFWELLNFYQFYLLSLSIKCFYLVKSVLILAHKITKLIPPFPKEFFGGGGEENQLCILPESFRRATLIMSYSQAFKFENRWRVQKSSPQNRWVWKASVYSNWWGECSLTIVKQWLNAWWKLKKKKNSKNT